LAEGERDEEDGKAMLRRCLCQPGPQGMTLLEVSVKILAIRGLEKSKYHIEMVASWCGAVASVDLTKSSSFNNKLTVESQSFQVRCIHN